MSLEIARKQKSVARTQGSEQIMTKTIDLTAPELKGEWEPIIEQQIYAIQKYTNDLREKTQDSDDLDEEQKGLWEEKLVEAHMILTQFLNVFSDPH